MQWRTLPWDRRSKKNEDVTHFMLLRFARPWNKAFTHRLAFPSRLLPIKRLPPAGMCSFDPHRRIKLQLANQTTYLLDQPQKQ